MGRREQSTTRKLIKHLFILPLYAIIFLWFQAGNNGNDGSVLSPGFSGSFVGASVGCSVGAAVGSWVGSSVGCSVGAAVGSWVGASVGCSVGTAVGSWVGASVGCSVGAAVGSWVGSSVGRSVGADDSVTIGITCFGCFPFEPMKENSAVNRAIRIASIFCSIAFFLPFYSRGIPSG